MVIHLDAALLLRLKRLPRDFQAGRLLSVETSQIGLAPDGVYHAPSVTGRPVSSYLTLSAFPSFPKKPDGSLLSVTLSRRLPSVAVSDHPARWSPDFPRFERIEARPCTHPDAARGLLAL